MPPALSANASAGNIPARYPLVLIKRVNASRESEFRPKGMIYMPIDINLLTQLQTLGFTQTLLNQLNRAASNSLIRPAATVGAIENLVLANEIGQFLSGSLANLQAINLAELNLLNAVSLLNSDNPNSVFNETTATSSNPEAATAAALPGAEPGVFELNVNQLAQGQTVAGTALNAQAQTGVTTNEGFGLLQFNINGSQRFVTFQLNGNETNQQALNTIATAINNADIGINAGVTTQNGNATLNLTGPTGAANAFTVTDIAGNAAAFTGIGNPANVTQAALNADFTVNGTAFSTPTNQPTLADQGVQLNLLQTTGTQPVTITLNETQNTGITQAINDFVTAFNQALTTLEENPLLVSQLNATSLSLLTEAAAIFLNTIGITIGLGGVMSVDQDQLQEAQETNPEAVEEAFNGSSAFSLAVQLQAESIINQSLSLATGASFQSIFNTGLPSTNSNNVIVANFGLFFNNVA